MLGDVISGNLKHINYSAVLKDNLKFQKEEQDKNFILSAISKELPIKAKKQDIAKSDNESKTAALEEQELPVEVEEEIVPPGEEQPVVAEAIAKQTEVVQTNNLPENYNTIYESVKIKNETGFNLSEDILIPNVEFEDKTNIIIYHTHTCESYTQTKENSYTPSRKF